MSEWVWSGVKWVSRLEKQFKVEVLWPSEEVMAKGLIKAGCSLALSLWKPQIAINNCRDLIEQSKAFVIYLSMAIFNDPK